MLVVNLDKLKSGETSVGRNSDSDIYIPDMYVSRLQGFFLKENGVVSFSDGGSKNGSRLNGQPLMPFKNYEINKGDILEFADVGLKIQ